MKIRKELKGSLRDIGMTVKGKEVKKRSRRIWEKDEEKRNRGGECMLDIGLVRERGEI